MVGATGTAGGSRKTEDGVARQGGSVLVGTRLPSGSLWVPPCLWVAVPYLRWLWRRQHPPLPSSGRAGPMPLRSEGAGRLRAGSALTLASLEGLGLAGTGARGAPQEPPTRTHARWPPRPRLVPFLAEQRDTKRHRCHPLGTGMGRDVSPHTQRCRGPARTRAHRGESPPTPPAQGGGEDPQGATPLGDPICHPSGAAPNPCVP